MNSKIKKTRDGMSYNKSKRVKKDTLYYITQKIVGNITDVALEDQDDDFKAEYQKIKRIKKLILDTYPFKELKDMKKSNKYLYGLIELVYSSNSFENILKKLKYNEELDIHERREYFKSIKYFLGESSLEEHPDYKNFKEVIELLDVVEDIQKSIISDLNIIKYIYDNTDDIIRVKEYIYEYKETMSRALSELQTKILLDKLSIKERGKNKEKIEEDCITYKYNEVEKELEKNINIVNEKTIIIDCMGKSYREIEEEGYLKNLPIDEVIYVDMKMEFK